MNPVPDVLETELYRVAYALQSKSLPLIIGGGYGLLLWQRFVQDSEHHTLRLVPEARSTEDLDIFFSVEVMSEVENAKTIRQVLDELGYSVIEGRENYQFDRQVSHRGQNRSVKIDLLAPVPGNEEEAGNLRIKDRRLRPKGFKGLHAHPAPEALTLNESLLEVKLAPRQAPMEISNSPTVSVFVPHLFTFLMLKLFAYRDRIDDPSVDYGQHHAYDIYRSIAMMTQEDWNKAHQIRDHYRGEAAVEEARQIAAEHFKSLEGSGALALRNYARTRSVLIDPEDVEAFTKDLHELFGGAHTAS